MAYILQTPDGFKTSAKVYRDILPARRAAIRNARRTGAAVQVWWINDAGIAKAMEYVANPPNKES